MKYLGDKKSWLIAFVSSLGILLVNLVFTPSVYRWSGATVTECACDTATEVPADYCGTGPGQIICLDQQDRV